MPKGLSRPRHAVTQSRSHGLVITIDGPAGSGKSTTAKLLSHQLGFMYLDTGATYRTLAVAAKQRQLHPLADADRIVRLARRLRIRLSMSPDGRVRIELAGRDVSREIRTEEVTEAAALISQHPAVRAAMVRLQRALATRYLRRAGARGVVVEGRDTGSVVFPRAPLKFFLDADPAARARRRQEELTRLYGSRTPLAHIRGQLAFRDGLDRRRRVGPLVKPRGAIAIDTTHRSTQEVVHLMLQHLENHRTKSPSTKSQ